MRRAITIWVRSDWKHRRASLVALTLLAGIAFGFVGTAFAGARRTATSFDRLRAATLAYDYGVVLDAPGTYPDPARNRYDDAKVERIKHLSQIGTAGAVVNYVAALPGADWEFGLMAPEDGTVGHQIERDRVLRGRLPDVHRADEVVVNESSVKQARLDVGDVLRVGTLSPAQRLRILAGDPHAFDHGPLGPELELHVVGIFRGVDDVSGRDSPTIFATPAFDRAYRGRAAYSARILLIRRAPGSSADAFHTALARVTAPGPLGEFDSAAENKPARQTTHTLAVGLLVFAAIAAIVSMLVVGQAVARHASGAEPDQSSLAAIGLTRAERGWGIVGTVVPVALFGAIVAGAVATIASSLMPVGLARRIEPHPGLQFDPFVTGAVALALIVVVVGAGLLAAVGLTRGDRRQRSARTSRVSTSLGSTGAGPVITTGARLAFDRRPPALPVRSAILGIGGAVAVVVASLTFSASLDRLVANHERWGYGWDFMLDTTPEGSAQLTRELAANPDVRSVSMLATTFTFLDKSDGIRAYGLQGEHGEVEFALRSGVQPTGPDEVVIGPLTARNQHLSVGDNMNVSVCPCTGNPTEEAMGKVRVVGIALFPEDDAGNFTNALGFSGAGFKRHAGAFSADSRAAVTVAAGRDPDSVARDLSRRYPDQVSQYSYPSRPGEVENLDGLRRFPWILAGFTALLGLAALENLLVTTLRRRRRELATLRTLGFTPAQTGRCIAWQSLSLAVVAVAVGTPLGLLAGARVWAATTQSIGVATDSNDPALAIGAFALVTLALAVAISVPVGWRAARIRTAAALRSE